MSARKIYRQNMHRACLELLRHSSAGWAVDDTLNALGRGVEGSIRFIDEAQDSGDADYAQAVTDSECEHIEHLLGTMFVVCQGLITRVVSRVKRLHELCDRLGPQLRTTNGEKWEIMALSHDPRPLGTYSKVQIIDAFANYFKHRDEWRFDWDCPDDRAKRTVQVIGASGATAGSTGNFLRAARLLGLEQYHDLRPVLRTLKAWTDLVFESYRNELKAAGKV